MASARSSALTSAMLCLLAACTDSARDPENSDASVPSSVLDAGLGLVSAELCPTLEPVCADKSPSYKNEVVPLIQLRCATPGCHVGVAGGPWPLNDYQELADWSYSVKVDLQACSMPPTDSGVPFTLQERMVLWQWLNCGTPNN